MTSGICGGKSYKNDSFETELSEQIAGVFQVGVVGAEEMEKLRRLYNRQKRNSGEKAALHFNSAVVAQRVELKRNRHTHLNFIVKAKEDLQL